MVLSAWCYVHGVKCMVLRTALSSINLLNPARGAALAAEAADHVSKAEELLKLMSVAAKAAEGAMQTEEAQLRQQLAKQETVGGEFEGEYVSGL